MRSAVFFILSLALHIGALLYPLSFAVPARERLIPVTIVAAERAPIGALDVLKSGAGKASDSLQSAPPRPLAQPIARRLFDDLPTTPDPPSELDATAPNESPIALVSEVSQAAKINSRTVFGSAPNALARYGGNVGGSTQGGGRGAGSGSGRGKAAGGIVLSQARLNETPRPVYPESARREGLEGRVLLRVLVDDRGRAKTVEINTSSGNEVLDRAAAEAIKRWRFYPARYGDRAVESWVKIPIEFALANANAR